MKKFCILLCVLTALGLYSCSQEEAYVEGTASKGLTAQIPAYQFESDTRVSFCDDLHTITWSTGDKIGIYASNANVNAFAGYEIKEGNTSLGTFSNDFFSLKPGKEYYAFYPLSSSATISSAPVDYTNQIQTTNNSVSHLGNYNYMCGKVEVETNGNSYVNFKNIGAVLRFELKATEATTVASITLTSDESSFIRKGQLNMETGGISPLSTSSSTTLNFGSSIALNEDDVLVAHIMIAPVNMEGCNITCKLKDSNGEVLVTKFEGNDFQQGKAYLFKTDLPNSSKISVVNTAGQLKNLLGAKDLSKIKELTLSGDVNFDDAVTIRKMTNLEVLNMADMNVVSGGIHTKDSVYIKYRRDEYNITIKDYWQVIDRNEGGTDNNWQANKINAYMFMGLYNLKKVIFPTSVSSIEYRAFYGCAYLEDLNLPANINAIWGDAFSYCLELRQVYIPNSVKWFCHPFFSCYNLESIEFAPGSCSEQFFPMDGFWNSKLTNVILPDIKTYQYTDAPIFYSNNLLQSFTIPSSVENAAISFSDVPALKDIYMYAEPTSSITFSTSDSKAGIKLHVPSGRKADYSKYNSFSQFTIVDDL